MKFINFKNPDELVFIFIKVSGKIKELNRVSPGELKKFLEAYLEHEIKMHQGEAKGDKYLELWKNALKTCKEIKPEDLEYTLKV